MQDSAVWVESSALLKLSGLRLEHATASTRWELVQPAVDKAGPAVLLFDQESPGFTKAFCERGVPGDASYRPRQLGRSLRRSNQPAAVLLEKDGRLAGA
jgi:hypothetical protein